MDKPKDQDRGKGEAIHLRPPGVRKCEFPHEFTLELVQNRTG